MPAPMQEPDNDTEQEFADVICAKLGSHEDTATDNYLQNGECGERKPNDINRGQAEYCELCKLWLNGPTQIRQRERQGETERD